jgi:hypothetical protein
MPAFDPLDGVIGRPAFQSLEILGAALQADGGNEVRGYGLKHQKEKRSMDHFAGLDVSVKETSICVVDDTGRIVREVKASIKPSDARSNSGRRVARAVHEREAEPR